MADEAITHEPQPPLDLKSVDIGRIVPDIERYNRQHDMPAFIFSIIASQIEEPNEPREKVPPLTLEDLQRKHASELEATGLALEPVRVFATGFTAEGEVPFSEIRLNLADGDKYKGYLESLSPETISPSQAEGLKTVAGILTQQLISEYRLADPNDERMLELFGNISGIISRYHELDPEGTNGISTSIDQLSILWEIAQKKYLREYLAVKNNGLLNGATFFGPAAWHNDSSPDFYMGRWKQAVEIARFIGKNPHAVQLQVKTVDALLRDAQFARDDITQRIAREGKHSGPQSDFYTTIDPDLLIIVEENLKNLQTLKAEIDSKNVS